MLIYLNTIKSAVDKTVKYLFKTQYDQVVEFVYINKNDGKDIICVPSQTSCKMGCSFCFLTASNNKVMNLTENDILSGINYVLCHVDPRQFTLLISFMGSGEPLNNLSNVIRTIELAEKRYQRKYATVRFAIASIIPSYAAMETLISWEVPARIRIKFHLSTHSFRDEVRKKLMPAALDIKTSLRLLAQFGLTDNQTELHYALIEDVNDAIADLNALIDYYRTFASYQFPPVLKLLQFKAGSDATLRPSPQLELFCASLTTNKIPYEIYDSPGSDILASCGQFMSDGSKSNLVSLAASKKSLLKPMENS